MIAVSGGPSGYSVSYTGRVLRRLVELATVAKTRGIGEEYLTALREFDRRLHIYPQFGDPLNDLRDGAGQVRLGVVTPLAMRYVVREDKKLVIVAALPVLLWRSR